MQKLPPTRIRNILLFPRLTLHLLLPMTKFFYLILSVDAAVVADSVDTVDTKPPRSVQEPNFVAA